MTHENRRYWYGSSPNLHNANANLTPSSPILISGDITSKSPPYYYHSSVALDTPNSHYPPPTNSNTATTKTTTLKSNKMPGPRQQMSSSNNNFSGPSSNGGFGRRHTSTAATGDFDYSAPPNAMHQNHHHQHNHHSAPSYNVEHLASFAVGSHFSVLSPADGVRKLKQMEQNSAICPVPMIFSLFPNRISVSELNGNLVEEFPMDLVSDPTAHTSSDPRDTFNNMLLFIVLEHVVSDGGTVPTELHIFQCINVPGGEVAEDLYNYIRGHYHKVGKRSPTKAMAASVYPNPLNEMPRGHFSHDSPSNGVEYFEMDVNTLNRCFDDIERFVARVQSVALAQRELEMQKNDGKQRKSKKAKEAAKAAQNGILHLRAQMPTQDEFVDIFQKFKLCFNLLAKLKNHIHEPSSPELIHFLFTPLTVLLDACHWGLGQQVAQQVCSPLLSYEACELLQVYLFPKETEVWHALGRAWNTPPEDWLGTLPPPYRPVFSDGWAPYGYSAQNIAPPPPTLTEPSVSSSIHPHQSDQNHHHQQQQHQQRFGGAPAIHRGFSVPAQAGQSRFYYEPSRIRDDSVHRERRTAVDNIELDRINFEKVKINILMGNAESNAAGRHGGSGKLRQSKKAKKEKRSCSEHSEQLQIQQRNTSTEQEKQKKKQKQEKGDKEEKEESISAKFIRMPRRLTHKSSKGTAASACCCTRLAAQRMPRMAEETVAMSRTTVTSAIVEERVAVAAIATAVLWHDMNGASLATAGAVLSAAVAGTAKSKRRGGSGRNGAQRNGGSTKSDRSARSDGSPSVAFGCAADRPDAVAIVLADAMDDNASLDEANLTSGNASSSCAVASTGGRLGDGIRRQRPAGRSFDGRRAKSFRLQHINGRCVPHPYSVGPSQPSIAPGGIRLRPQAMANGAMEQQLGMLCPITALTLPQKRLILARWRQLSAADILRLSENIFERTFRRNESFARTVLRQNDRNWKNLPQFRVLTMRFSYALSALCASLADDAAPGAELLAEFGAQHAIGLDNGQVVPPSYWDVLLLAICEAAGAGEGQQQIECFSPAGCALSAGSSLSASSSGVSSSSPSASAPPPPMLLPQWTRRSADAWAQFSVFVSAQMRFGYEMERFLRERMRKRMQQEKVPVHRRRSLSANGSLAMLATDSARKRVAAAQRGSGSGRTAEEEEEEAEEKTERSE